MKQNDILWKAALEYLFDDFLRFFLPMPTCCLISVKGSNTWIKNSTNFSHLKMMNMCQDMWINL
jgi:hypothetical protein